MKGFGVSLHHLTPDAGQAGTRFPDLGLEDVSPEKLHALLQSFAALALHCAYPVTPELRITGSTGLFLVRARDGRVRVSSWSLKSEQADLRPEQILALVTGENVAAAKTEPVAKPPPQPQPQSASTSQRGIRALLLVAILAINAVTIWMVMRPSAALPVEILPPYQPMDADQAKRMYAQFAGSYEMSDAGGGRRLTIAEDGRLTWMRLSPQRTVLEKQELTSQAARCGGRSVLIAGNLGMIERVDPITIAYFSDIYRRQGP